jgi:hypothetical protein
MHQSNTSFEDVLRLAREIKSNPGDQSKAQSLAQSVIDVDEGFSNGTTQYPTRWSAASTR